MAYLWQQKELTMNLNLDGLVEAIVKEVVDKVVCQMKINDDLQVFTTEEAAELLRTHPDKVNCWRRMGLLKAIKKGSGYIYTSDSIKSFLKEYDGCDLSNEDMVLLEVKKRASGASSVGY